MNHERELWEKRQRAREAEEEKALDIMGDATVRPLPRKAPKAPVNAAGAESGQTADVEAKHAASGARSSSASGIRAFSAATGTKSSAATVAAVKAAAKAGGTRRSRSAGPRVVSEAALQTAAAGTDSGSGVVHGSGNGSGFGAGSGSGGGGSEVRRRLEEEAAKRRKRRRIITMIIAECIALVFIFVYAYVARQLNKIQRPEDFKISELQTNELNVDTVETMKGYWTIAIFGVDARNNAINKGTNADVNMICNINRDTGEIKLVSVFRDTYLNISEGGNYNKLNQAYFVGGPEQAVQALNRNLDLQINDYMTFNWKAVADAINVLDGVDIELSDAEFYYINGFITETVKATGIGSKHLTHAGMNHLDGVQAVAYGRLRLMDTDFARTERQRKIIAKAFEKAKSADFKKLNTLIGTVFPQVSTSIWVDDLVANAKNISKFHLGETMGFPQARGDVNMGKKGSVVVPQTLESNVIKLHEFLYGDAEYTPSQTVKNISAKISSDSGMYREGKYVDHVSTEGVIQKPKATAAATTAADETKASTKKTTEAETDEDGNPIEFETDEDGNVITRPTAAVRPGSAAVETDEDGNRIESEETETDEDGNRIETEEAETDEEGNPIESGESETDEDGNWIEDETLTSTKPSSAASATRPTSSTGNGVTTRPGSMTETTAGTTTSRVPGSTGSSTEPTSGNSVSTRPGSTTPGRVPGTTAATTPGSTGSSTEPTSGNGVTTRPGSTTGNTGTTAAKVPGSTGSSTGSTNGGGAVSAPGANSASGVTTTKVPGSNPSSGTAPATTPGTSTSAVPTAAQTPTASDNGIVSGPGQ